MSFNILIPFYAVKLHLSTGGNFTSPLLDNNVLRASEPVYMLAGKYAELFQRKVLNKGDYLKVLNEYSTGEHYKSELTVDFRAAKDKMSFPAFSLTFEFFYKEVHNGFWGIVPTLGVESFSDSLEQLHVSLEEVVRMEFTRKRRLVAVQQIVAAIWFDTIEMQRHDMALKVLTPKELENVSEQSSELLLPKVAQMLRVQRQITYGRKEEIDTVVKALKGKFNKSLILVGASGVGKTALVWEIASKKLEHGLSNDIWETTASVLIKELTGNTGWQDNIVFLCKELSESGDIIFVRNLLELFEVGQYQGNSVSMAGFMRGYISRGEITMISECTEEELQMIELRSPNFLASFHVIRMEEPPTDELEDIITRKVKDIALDIDTELEEEAIKETIRLNRRFTPYAGFPGKPIRFLESILINQKENNQTKAKIDRSIVIQHFCEETGMPEFIVNPTIPMQPRKIRAKFNANIFGQEKAVQQSVDVLASVKTALAKTGKPIASFLFVGPTGVGKTEMARVLSDFMFGSRDRMIRFDMSEYADPYSVTRLLGTDYFSDGLLTSAVRKDPFCVLLFDEIEKAHPNFYDLLLQILSEGRLTDSKGKLVNFCSTIIIMTSNIGASNLQNNRISWSQDLDVEEVTNHFMGAVQKHFRPELYNRIDQVIPFEPLSKTTVRFVVDREIELLKKREGVQFRGMSLNIEDEVLDYLAEAGYDSIYGARQLQRKIKELLIVPLARQLNVFDYDDQLVVNTVMNDGTLSINIESDPLGTDLWIEELEKVNYADYASELRRQIRHLQEGSFFIRLLSSLDILEREKKREKEKFWNNKERSDHYSYLLELKERVGDMTRQIENHEIDISLTCMDITPYDPSIVDEFKKWDAAFFALKIEMYLRVNLGSDTCYFGIYGSKPQQAFQFYKEIAKAKDFKFEAKSVWFRDKYYNEEIIVSKSEIDEDGNEIQTENIQAREDYLYVDIKGNDKKDFKPTQKGDLLMGVVFKFTGTIPFLYLKEEAGVQRWKNNNDDDQLLVVRVYEKPVAISEKIHRRDFYTKENPRRTIETNMLKDNRYKIEREINKNDAAKHIIEYLDDQFTLALNKALL